MPKPQLKPLKNLVDSIGFILKQILFRMYMGVEKGMSLPVPSWSSQMFMSSGVHHLHHYLIYIMR